MRIAETVNIIDTIIKQNITFAPQRAFGLAAKYYEDKVYYPGILNSQTGEITDCILDDNYALSWYHRNETGNFALDTMQFGDEDVNQIETNIIDLIVTYDTTKIKRSGSELKDMIIDAFPAKFTKLVSESLGLNSVSLVLVSFDLDSTKVFKQECNKDIPNVSVGVQFGLLQIRYNLISTYTRRCAITCCN